MVDIIIQCANSNSGYHLEINREKGAEDLKRTGSSKGEIAP